MLRNRQWQAFVSQGTFVLVVAVLGSALLGFTGLWLVEQELVARAGESLALGAAEVAGKLDAMLQERDGDIEMLAVAPQVHSTNVPKMTEYLHAVQRAYPVYARLAVTDQAGRVMASTDQMWVGQDVREASWFQALRPGRGVYAEVDMDDRLSTGQLKAVVYAAPIQDASGKFVGAIMTEVDQPLWHRLVEDTVKQFARQTKSFGTVEYRIVGTGGDILLTRDEADKSGVNLREGGLPSAINVAAGRPGHSGYVEELHLVRKVPVLTGYARMQGVRSLPDLQWGVLVRADRADVLANVRGVLLKIGLAGVAGFVLMLSLVMWVKGCQQREQNKAAESRQLVRDRDAQLSAIVEHAVDGIIGLDHAGCIRSLNRAAENLFGYSATDLIGRNVALLMPEWSLSELQGDVEDQPRTGKAGMMGPGREMTGRRRDGSVFPMELTVSELRIGGERYFTGWVRDVTARKQAEKMMRENAALMRAVVTGAMDAIVLVDGEGRIVGWNRQAVHTFGWSEEEALGRALDQTIIPPLLREAHRAGFARFLETGVGRVSGRTIEITAVRKTGEEFPIELTITPLRLDSGVMFSAFLRDITERKQIVDRLNARETFFRLLSEHLPIGVFELDDEGRCIYTNKTWNSIVQSDLKEVFGFSEAGVSMDNWLEWFHAEDRQEMHKAWETTRASRSRLHQELRLTGEGSETQWVQVVVWAMASDKGVRYLGSIEDITARRQLMERHREREMFFRLLSEHLPIGVFEIDEEGSCRYTNKTWTTIFRKDVEEVFGFGAATGSEGNWMEWFHPDDRPAMREAWEISRDSFAQIRQECRLVPDGSEVRWVQILLWPMANDLGFRYLGTVEDITARKQTIAHTMQLLRHGRFELQTLSEARSLAELLAYAFPDPSRTQLGLTELFVNGVEHGNLEISYTEKSLLLEEGRLEEEMSRRLALPENRRKRVWVSMDRKDTELEMTIADDGKGFDWHRYLVLDDTRSDDAHGRGIAMSKSISFDRLEYRTPGNQVKVSTRLTPSEPGADEATEPEAA